MKIRSFVVLLFVLAAGLSMVACGSPTSSTNIATIAVTGTVPAVGGSAQFFATATLASGGTEDVTNSAAWTSSNTAVATVSSTGLVTSVASGSVTITATDSGVGGSEAITVP